MIGKKKGSKRNLLTEEYGIPLSLTIVDAKTHDVTQFQAVLENKMIQPIIDTEQNLICDKGYISQEVERYSTENGYIVHIPKRKITKLRTNKNLTDEEIQKTLDEINEKNKNLIPKEIRNKRFVVERTHSWMNGFKKIRFRYDKKSINYEALCHFACAMIVFRKIIKIYK